MQHFFKTYTICQRYVKFNGTLDAFFNKVGGLLDRTVEWDAIDGICCNDGSENITGA